MNLIPLMRLVGGNHYTTIFNGNYNCYVIVFDRCTPKYLSKIKLQNLTRVSGYWSGLDSVVESTWRCQKLSSIFGRNNRLWLWPKNLASWQTIYRSINCTQDNNLANNPYFMNLIYHKVQQISTYLLSNIYYYHKIFAQQKNNYMLRTLNTLIVSIICVLLCVSECGRIKNGDLSVDYANAGLMTELSFSFMLENSINSDDYIKVSLPFPLHAQLTPAVPAMEGLSSPSSVVVTYQLMNQFTELNPLISYCQILTETIDSSNYFIRFYASDRKTLINIAKNQWYYLKFKLQTTDALQFQKSNSILQIQISTVSSVWSNAIVYDDNLAFNYFQLGSAPSKSITIVSTPFNFGAAGGYLLTQAVYQTYLDVTVGVSSFHFNQNMVLRFLISQDNSFVWNGNCSSVAKTNVPKISLLDSSLYTCVIDVVKNTMEVTLKPAALALQTSYRFKVGIKNPPVVIKDVNIVVRALKEKSSLIIGYGEALKALNTNQIYITYQQIFLGWGLRPDSLLPFNARIFRGNSATPNYMPYNSLSLKFSISQNTSSTTELKILIDIPSETDAFVLQNGFTTNLPAFSNKIVKCAAEEVSSPTTRKIGCTGVGSLSKDIVYYVGWKMFFPYDNYESSISCTSFATLTVQTCKPITNQDVTFVLGRSDQFLSYLKSSPDYIVVGRNATYISYMKTFLSLNLMVLSNDFQEFLKYPESIFLTNRPKTYANKTFNDVYIITQNLAFLTYISLFNDIYVAARLKSNSDIIKGYDTYPLIAKTTPKNTLTLLTSNSKDWTDFTAGDPLISSSTTVSTTPATGLKISGSNQALIFSIKAGFSDVTTFSNVGSTSLTNNWGLMIMTNSLIALPSNSTPVLTQSAASGLTITAQTVNSNASYNKYSLITIRGTLSSQVQTIFPITAAKVNFAVSPFGISNYASIYADDNNMDFMIASIDGIDGPTNKIVYNGYFLINGFSMAPSNLNTINMQFVNYQSSAPMDGSLIPTFLRIKGTIADTNVDSLTIFFDKLTPFYENYYSGDIYCYSTDGAPYCTYKKGAATGSISKYNYNSMNRFQIALTNPSTSFDILIPVTFSVSQTTTNFYMGYQKLNPTTNVRYLAYTEVMRLITLTGTAAQGGTYGPVVATNKVGQTVTNMGLNAKYSGSITVNSGSNIGGAFSYFSQWNYINSATVTGWAGAAFCHKIKYLYYYTNYDLFLNGTTFSSSYKIMNGIVCFVDSAVTTTNLVLTISSGTLPSKWGKKLPGYGGYSQNTGLLLDYKINSQDIGNSEVATTVVPPISGRSLQKAIGQWDFTLPISLDGNVKIVITGASGANIPYTPSGTCAVFIGSVKTTVGCNFATAPTYIQYILSINEQGLLPKATTISIVQYGHYTSSAILSNVNVNIVCYSLLDTSAPTTPNLIFTATATILWEPVGVYLGASQLKLGNFNKQTLNKNTYSDFDFTFNLISKGLYVTNRVRIDLGQLAVDNTGSSVSPKCVVLDYLASGINEQYSHDWSSVDTSQGLDKLQLWPQKNLVSSNLTYRVKCYNYLTTSSPTPITMTAKIANLSADLTGDLSSTINITPMQLLYTNNKTSQVTLTKKYTIPSSLVEMSFQITSPGITIQSIMYLGFPAYYANGLGPDIKCYTTSEIYCTVVERFLTIKYLGTYGEGTVFTLLVVGVTQPINYNSGVFYYLIDTDDNPISVLSSGTFTDSVSSTVLIIQNFPTFPIYSLTQSSSYLREQDVTLTIEFFLSTSLPTISVGQYLYLLFPPNYFDILRFITPTCSLNLRGNTLKNYINSCQAKGMRLKMAFLDDISLGNTYSLIISGLINPTNPSSNVYRYSLQISNAATDSIIAKSYSPHCNFNMPIFTMNPNRLSLNYYTVANGLVSSITTMANLQSEQVFISPGPNLTSSIYQRNVYLTVLNTLYSIPSKINLNSGANPFPIRMSSLTAGVNYVYFDKSGDGNFYSNLPPLVLISNKNYFTPLSFKQTLFTLAVGPVGTIYSIVVNLNTELFPMSEVSMTVTLGTAIGLSLKNNPTVITFYPQKTSATILLIINDITLWIAGASTTLIITPTLTSTYASAATLSLNAIALSSNVPVLTLNSNSQSFKQFNFNIGCSQFGKAIYHVSRKFSYNYTACELTPELIIYWGQQSSIDGLRVTQTYYNCKDIIGTVNIISTSATQILKISNLQASNLYTIRAFCQTQHGISSAVTALDFNTMDNGGVISKIDFMFVTPLTISQKIKLSCALALYFKVDYTKVSTYDGYYCSELLSRRLLMMETQTVSKQLSPRLVQSASYRTEVYLGINNNLNSDTSKTLILTQSQGIALKNEINNNVVGLPQLVSYSQSSQSYIGPNTLTSVPLIETGPTYLFIRGLSMSNNGLIYIIAGETSKWTRAPTVSEIKQGSGPNGLASALYRVLPYRTSEATSGSMSWTNMPQGLFTLYILPSDDNPFDTANFFSAISSYNVSREIPKSNDYLVLCVCLMLTLAFTF